MLWIIYVAYAVLLLTFLLMSLFVIYHIVRYAYSRTESMLMLSIFIPVVTVLLFIQIMLFMSIRFDEIFYFLS